MDIRTFFVTQDREKSTDSVEGATAQESTDSVEGETAQESTDSVEGETAQESIDSVEGAAAQESDSFCAWFSPSTAVHAYGLCLLQAMKSLVEGLGASIHMFT